LSGDSRRSSPDSLRRSERVCSNEKLSPHRCNGRLLHPLVLKNALPPGEGCDADRPAGKHAVGSGKSGEVAARISRARDWRRKPLSELERKLMVGKLCRPQEMPKFAWSSWPTTRHWRRRDREHAAQAKDSVPPLRIEDESANSRKRVAISPAGEPPAEIQVR